MKKANPVAFESSKQAKPQIDENMLSETLSDVRYVAQRGKYADFVPVALGRCGFCHSYFFNL